MNDILASIYSRKSMRTFLDKPVDDDVKREVYNAACQAPTAGNQQLYTILDIVDLGIKQRLSELCDNQPIIARAPMVAVFLADQQRWYDSYISAGLSPRTPGYGDIMLAVTDAAIAAQNAVVAAESLGLGSCYIGDIMENCIQVRELLRLPEYVFPCCMLIMGYPTQAGIKRKKPDRLSLEYIVKSDTYKPLTARELIRMHTEQKTRNDKTGFDYNTWMEAFYRRKYESEFSLEMTRSVAEYLKAFSGDVSKPL